MKLHPNLVQPSMPYGNYHNGPMKVFRMKQRESLPSSSFSRKTLQVGNTGLLQKLVLGEIDVLSGKIKAVSVCTGDSVSYFFKSKMYSVKYSRENSALYRELNRKF